MQGGELREIKTSTRCAAGNTGFVANIDVKIFLTGWMR